MDGQTFVVDLAPYGVTAVGIIVAGIWGSSALKAKNDVLAAKNEVVVAKDEQLRAIAAAKDEQIQTLKTALAETIRVKDIHIQMLEQFRPTSLLEQLRAFIVWNEELSTQLTKSRGEVEASVAAKEGSSKELEKMKQHVKRLTEDLARAESSRKVAEKLADTLRLLPADTGGRLAFSVGSTEGLFGAIKGAERTFSASLFGDSAPPITFSASPLITGGGLIVEGGSILQPKKREEPAHKAPKKAD